MWNDVRLTEQAGLELVNLRGRMQAARFVTAARDAFGIELPGTPNTVAAGAAYTALWLGPDEWLLRSNDPRPATAERTLRPLLADEFAAVVDVSSGYAVLELEGTRTREVLRKGCPVDLHPRVFGVGQCAQSHYFKAGIILRPTAPDACELIVRRSFADYTARILLDAILPPS
jgi:sarcosine oxidase, subunit gamma